MIHRIKALLDDLEIPIIVGLLFITWYVVDSFLGEQVARPQAEGVIRSFLAGVGLSSALPTVLICLRKSTDIGKLNDYRTIVMVGAAYVSYEAVIQYSAQISTILL